jgi:23S rRNA (cytidine1920-2'-O)/16S rRNA (cytidine1409-2'-O)-methyltransferase
MPKNRLDVLLVDRELAESREQAQKLIRAGLVSVNSQISSKPGHKFNDDVSIDLKALPKYVSRGGEKMDGAFEYFALDVKGLRCIDIGSSTGGFTDCLLQNGASKIIAVDVGKGQLHWKLRTDERVTVMEKVNARYLEADDLPWIPQFAVVDVAFISLTKILPAVIQVLEDGSGMVTLIKPQFEAGRSQVERGGVVRDEAVRLEVVERIKRFGVDELGLDCRGVCESPLKGPAGNVEFLAYWIKQA